MSVVFAPNLRENYIVQLEHLIEQHHRLVLATFKDFTLKPKHHFMIHYPRNIRQVGPLVHLWCMRFEGKH